MFEASCEPPASQGFTDQVATVALSAWELEVAGERLAVLLLPHSTFFWVVHDGAGLQPTDAAAAPAADSLTGGLGTDWFFAAGSDKLFDKESKLGEIVTDL